MGPLLQWYKKYSAVDSAAKCTIRRQPAYTSGLINIRARRIVDFQMKHSVLLP